MTVDDLTQTHPLSSGQRLMWLGQRVHDGQPLYNMIYAFHIRGALDAERFQAAFAHVAAAYDNLRTVIVEIDDEPRAQVLPTMPQPLEIVDLSQRPNPEAALDLWFDRRRAHPYQMDRCLYDTALIKLREDGFVWYFGQHHIMMDVWSSRLLYDRMRETYAALVTGETPALPDAPPYADFIAHEAEIAQSERYQAAAAFWQNEIARPTDPLRFYGARDDRLSTRTERHALQFDADIMAQLDDFSQQRGIRSLSRDLTFANIFTALVRAFLLRVTGAQTTRLGLPLANRSTPALQQTFGLMLEILSAHATIDPDASFRELVQAAATSNFATLQHTLPGIGSADHNRAYDVLVNSITVTFPDFAGLPTEVEWVHSGYGDSAHKLRLQIHDMSERGQIEMLFDFNTAHFDEQARQLTVTHFERFLRAVLRDPDQPISTILLLDDDEKQRYLHAFNATDATYPTEQTVIDLFEAQAERTPQAIALHHAGDEWTYAELNAAANHLAHSLRAKDIGSGSAVPVCLDHSAELVTAILAALKLGAHYIPIDPAYPDERLRYILADLGDVSLVLTQAEYAARFADTSADPLTVTLAVDDAPANPQRNTTGDDLAYMIYTSGSTGQPKGVQVAHDGLSNYLLWAREQYSANQALTFALYSSLAFDLTVTSLFLPLITGGTLRVYPPQGTYGTVIREIFAENAVDVIKLTPSHLALVRDMDLSATRIKTLIVGGEDFKTELAQAVHRASNGRITLYNEYGPTEGTVACMLHRYQPAQDVRTSVPIGTPATNMRAYILDERQQPVATGVIGELVISGVGVARGYLNRPELTAERFMPDPFNPERRAYRTGDLARWLPSGQLVFLGRADEQVKVGGARIELGEIEAALTAHPAIQAGAVLVRSSGAEQPGAPTPLQHCTRCGLSSQFPGITFDEAGVCSICTSYESYKDKAQQYFHPMDELVAMVDDIKARSQGAYDCIALLSGGKDSTYMLYRLVDLGLNVLTFTLDNGYISDEAKANIKRITHTLGVDHVFGETPFMNSIFVDSLQRYANVCNGCFKTIYTLAVNLAREKGISTIITGLSRGQFFETRLTEELFESDDFDVSAIDESIARARRAYHQRDDIISRSLDVDVFREEGLLDDIQFVDFYRYCDVDLDEVYRYLSERGGWVRPSDTGRSTNCLINDVGIWLHQQRRGFHSYELPYSWDVRLGHKTRDAALDELNDDIDEASVKRMLREIGYHDAIPTADDGQARLVAYYVADTPLSGAELRDFLGQRLPDYMLPAQYIALETMPLNANGKIDRDALPAISDGRAAVQAAYAPPSSELEAALVDIWQAVLNLPQIGVHDDFFDLGGHSLPAIRIASRIEARYEISLPLDVFFNHPTIAQLATAIEDILVRDIEALSEDELLRLLEEDEL